MTISSSTRKAGPFTGNGTTATYPFTFKIFQASDLLVVRTSLAGVDTTLTLTTDYTVSLNADQNSSPGGSITLTAGNLATGLKVTMTSRVPYTQTTDLTNQGGFYPQVITTALDKLTIGVQQLNEQVSRSAKLPISSTTDADVLVTNINTLANNLTTIQAVNANESNIDAVVGNEANINSVAGNSANIATVGSNAANINAVAGNNANVTTVATNIAAVNNVSTNMAAVQNAVTSASNAATSATNSANSATASAGSATAAAASQSAAASSASAASSSASAASTSATNSANSATAASTSAGNAASSASAAAGSATSAAGSEASASSSASNALARWNDFQGRYYGASATNPTVDPLGNPLGAGDLYFNTVVPEMRVYNGTAWVASASSPDTVVERSFLATAGQTSYTFTGGYRVNYTYVWVNGALLYTNEYTATNGTTITFASALALNDEIRIITFKAVGSVVISDIVGLQTQLDTINSNISAIPNPVAMALVFGS